MTCALTLGKYAPLHKGHQLVIEKALSEADHLIVMIYDAPETTTIPLTVRAGWIRRLYPSVEVIEAWDGPTIVGDSPEIIRMHDTYLMSQFAERTITHFYSSEFYGEHVSRALRAVDCRVDADRRQVPISGTAVRRDPYAYRKYIDPLVYRDLITRVVFLGAPSTGKTSLARELAKRYSTRWMPEYGREYWQQQQKDRRLSLNQLVEIADIHRKREDALAEQARDYLFVDTDATTTFVFSLYYHGRAEHRLAEFADEAAHRYDLFFLCEDDIPYDDTWDRSGHGNRCVFQKRIREDLLSRNTPFVSLPGSLDHRTQVVCDTLRGFDKWKSLRNSLIRTEPHSSGNHDG